MWEDPTARPSRDSSPQSHSIESGATSQVAVDPEVILEEERSRLLVVPNSSECPRLIDALDVASLVVRIRQENAGDAIQYKDKGNLGQIHQKCKADLNSKPLFEADA